MVSLLIYSTLAVCLILFPQVEIHRETGTRCFFPVVSLYLKVGILLAIACPYSILRGKILGGTTVLAMLFGNSVIFSFCHLSQAFIDKVK